MEQLQQRYKEAQAFYEKLRQEYEPMYTDWKENRRKHARLDSMAMRMKIERAKLEKMEADMKALTETRE